MKHWALGIAISALAAAIVAGCSSDDFGPVGTSLPPEVTQDSLSVEIEVAIDKAFDFEPDFEREAYTDRRALAFGRRLRSVRPEFADFRASMLLRFDFANPLQNTPLPPASKWSGAGIVLVRYNEDKYFGWPDKPDTNASRTRDIDVYTLNAPLAESMRDEELGGLLDRQVFSKSAFTNKVSHDYLILGNGSKGSVDTLSTSYTELRSWLSGAEHRGFAVVDQSTAYPDTLGDTQMRFAASEFPLRSVSLLPRLGAGTVWEATFRIKFEDPDEPGAEDFVSYPAILDFTHLEREAVSGERLSLATYRDSRIYLHPDLASAGIPSNASITRAYVELHADKEYSVVRSKIGALALEATEADAQVLTRAEFRAISRSLTSIDARSEDLFQMDVTEFVQRKVNGLLDDDVGLLIVLETTNQDLFRSLDFFADDAPASELRPRLVVQFTPPPDFQR